MNGLRAEVVKQLKTVKKQADALELTAALESTTTRASLDSIDEKFEDALKEVADSIEQYIGVVNDTSSKQYDDFNANLKSEFGKNLENIQGILNNLREELDGNTEKMADIEKTVNNVDVENQKRLDVVKDKIEIE
jgi:DNA anti-recombination protein RmuC